MKHTAGPKLSVQLRSRPFDMSRKSQKRRESKGPAKPEDAHAKGRSEKRVEILPPCARDLSKWPEHVKDGMVFGLTGIARGQINDALYAFLTEHGYAGFNIKNLNAIRKKTFELRAQDAAHWYRLAYTTEFRDVVYALHAFLKTTNQISPKDRDTIVERIKQLAAQTAKT